MIIKDFADFLEDNEIGTFGVDMFISELPDSVNGIVLYQVPSPPPNKSISYYLQDIDIWAIYPKYTDAYQKLEDILDLIHKEHHYEMGDYYIYLSSANGLIVDNERDSQSRHILQLSIGLLYRKIESGS
jgi:hypothetical protein